MSDGSRLFGDATKLKIRLPGEAAWISLDDYARRQKAAGIEPPPPPPKDKPR